MDDYYFLYLNSLNKWNRATNPKFIAEHKYCRAIPKEVVTSLGYEFVSDFVNDLNDIDLDDGSFCNIPEEICIEYNLI